MGKVGGNSGRRALLIAVVLGIVSAAMVMNYLKQATAAAKPLEMADEVVALADLPTRTLITKEMVKIQQVPVEFRHAAALATVDQVEGKVLRMPVTAGEPILSTKFVAQRQDSGLAFIVPPHKRAVSIAVSELIGAGGLIVPGDFVDVIGVFDDKMMAKDTSLHVLQNIEVLAVAQQKQGDDDAGVGAEVEKTAASTAKSAASTASASPSVTSRTVTLAVEPEQAARLVLAEERGKLRLALRAYKDSETSRVPESTIDTIREMAQR